jgi:hypothetical protein
MHGLDDNCWILCFALAEPERKRDDEPDSVALAQCQGQDALDLLGRERMDF